MHSDYVFKRAGSQSSASAPRQSVTGMPDLPTKQPKPRKPRAKREREATIYEQSIGKKLKAFVTGQAPKKLTKKRRRK